MTALLVANDGGHLQELWDLRDRFDLDDDVVWASVPPPQTESLLEGQDVVWTHRADTRDAAAVARNTRVLRGVVRRLRPTTIVSTGSSLALSACMAAAGTRARLHYVESLTRTIGPSLTGSILMRHPGVRLYTQWPHLQSSRWYHRGSVLDGYAPVSSGEGRIERMVVSVGTSKKYGFDRLVRTLADIVPPDVEVLWQTGYTDVTDLSIKASPHVPFEELKTAIERADVMVSHAGVGITLTALDAGLRPVLVPRRRSFAEHVDDHQMQIAGELQSKGLATTRAVEDLTWEDLCSAASGRVVRAENAPAFRLVRSRKEAHDVVR